MTSSAGRAAAPTRVSLWATIARDEVAAQLQAVQGIELTLVDSLEALHEVLTETEILVMPGHFYHEAVARLVHQSAGRLRFIQSISTGYEELQAHGVPPGVLVASAGDRLSVPVAEFGMALLLALTKCLPQAWSNQSRQLWDKQHLDAMNGLHGKTVVIIGLGNIGRAFARFARCFGMHIIGLRRQVTGDFDNDADEVLPIGELHASLPRADVIFIAAPYNVDTDGLIGAAELQCCKPGALLINVARGRIVDTDALLAALDSGRLGGAGLDVVHPEPLPADHPLWHAPNTIITPHIGGASGLPGKQSLARFIGANVGRFIQGETIQHRIYP
ncbi:D-2-hydroxyacid dehydrogenase [Pseudomonas sp. D5002]|uniref:D-2-hydroxyacid dehydrogenase n=1 Tax=Pseudomonas sp. D5002 TaxID=2738818 RepID=UPI00159F929A|nr:D-2-hydroxyacid dehydrogenase [Pseudomonas sp. D5002]NWB09100.1 D-2-hydroxyacid dehydrogenase [Pseudomonas sp. D5002]